MMTIHSNKLTLRQAVTRVAAGVALGSAIAVAIASLGSASAAKVDPGPVPGSAAASLSVLHTAPVEANPPSEVAVGFNGASALGDGVRLLGRNAGGSGLDLYASARSNGGACNSLASAKGPAGTMCVQNIPPEGITLGASDAAGWTLYGFAADDVVGVDVVLNGKPQPAMLLRNAYAADLGTADLSAATELIVHHADGSVDTVANNLRAPGS
jgi:hypothetical protein